MMMSAGEYRDSLRRYRPRVFVNGRRVESVADEPLLAPGIAGMRRAWKSTIRSAEEEASIVRMASRFRPSPVKSIVRRTRHNP